MVMCMALADAPINMNVAIIGASDNKERYSYMAVMLLKEKGHRVFPVHQRIKTIEGMPVAVSIEDVQEPIDTVTLYVAADISTRLAGAILAKNPRRIIFNPGAENPILFKQAQDKGIICLEACTLVMLRTGQF